MITIVVMITIEILISCDE